MQNITLPKYANRQQIERLKIILEKFGPSLRTLKLFKVSMSDVLSFLQLTPNLEDLSLWPTGNIDNVNIVNRPLLTKLTKLYMLDGFDDNCLNSLVPDNCLKILLIPTTEIQPSSLESINNLITKQKNLKEISGCLLGIVSIDNIQLERFTSIYVENFEKLVGQYNLLEIRIFGPCISDNNFKLICRMEQLKVLDVNINEVTAEAFRFISCLVSLEKLRVESRRYDCMENGIVAGDYNHPLNTKKVNADYFEKLIALLKIPN